MSSRPLRILVSSDDRKILRRLSTFLEAFGYEVRQAAGRAQLDAAFRAGLPACLILDVGESLAEAVPWCAELRGHAPDEYVHVLLLTDEPGPAILAEALAAGADDFLTRPVVYGEVLSRLRAAARTIEFERRLREQAGVDPLVGLPSHAALLDRLARRAAAGASQPAVCVALDVDFLEGVARQHGRDAADALIRAVGEKLIELHEPAEPIASLGAGRFAALLLGVSEEEAVAWAERIRAAVAETEFTVAGAAVRTSLSGAVVPVAAGADPQAVLEQAAAVLRWAKQSGRNVIVRAGEFSEEIRAWNEFVAQGRLFEGTIARDIMTPCTLALRSGDSLERAGSLLARSHLGVLPVVDDEGRLVGVLCGAALVARPGVDTSLATVEGVMEAPALARDEETRFDELMDFFRRQPTARLVIVRDGRPTGLVTANNLLALSVPLTAGSFAPTEPFSPSSSYLLVPDLAAADEE